MPDFLNTDGSVQTIALERFQYFLKICEENKLGTFPTFIVGHMSGEDWGMPWLRGSELIKDRSIIELTKSYIATVVQTGKGFKYVLGCCCSNELPNSSADRSAIVAEWICGNQPNCSAILIRNDRSASV
jgi:endo-1,4-beta-mannosidase